MFDQTFEEKQKSRELLKRKIQQYYGYIKDCLNQSDIEAILDRLYERCIFNDDLIDEIRANPKRFEKATLLIDNILRRDEEHMIYFLELIQFIMPNVYESITGNKGESFWLN